MNIDILRFITAGSVDDGKSTLIGRMLYDSKSILADQLEAIEKSTKNKADGEIDLALLTDGLRAEREQGITIDVAYRYFTTNKRKFIIADAPGHVQYTRNMITGASNVDLAIILIDARQGVVEQTKRHTMIAALLQIKHLVVAINKIDLVNYDEKIYNQIVNNYAALAQKAGVQTVAYFPISALKGDNIVEASAHTPWFKQQPLLSYLETVDVTKQYTQTQARFQVQYVIRPQVDELHDYRGYAGKVLSGTYKKGDAVKILPSGITTTIDKIELYGTEVPQAFEGQSVTILLTNDIDISRGDSIVNATDDIQLTQQPKAIVCWLDEKPLQLGNKYILQHHHKRVRVAIKSVDYKIDVNSFEQINEVSKIALNEIAHVSLKAAEPLVIDAYNTNKHNGCAILIDETSNNTVAAVLFQ